MNSELKTWLYQRWIRDNHKKYHKYFEEWYNNLFSFQKEGFKKQLINIKDNIYNK